MTTPTNGTTNGTHGPTGQQADLDIDTLYSWVAPQTPPQPCPEALFSCTLKGTIGGHDTLLTVRGMTSAEFQRNLQSITGILDPMPTPASPQGQPQGQADTPQCPKHGAMRRGKRGWFCPVKVGDGYCTYAVKA